MSRIVRHPTEAPRRFPSGACHGARPEDPVRCPPVPPASGASRSRGRRDRRTFEAAEAELLQPGERPARGARARGPGAPDTEAAAHPRRPVSEPPTALKQAASESTLPRDEPIGPPTCSAPWASASVSDAVEQIRPPASRCARPARVHQCQAARPLAPIQCCRRVTQPISSRDGVS